MSGLSFTDKANAAIVAALGIARDSSHVQTGPVHLALALLGEPGSGTLLRSLVDRVGGDALTLSRSLNKLLVKLPSQEPAGEPDVSPALHKVLREAQSIMKMRADSFISEDHLILALLSDSTLAQPFKEAHVTSSALTDAINKLRAGKRVENRSSDANYESLAKYAINLTALAAEGKLEPVIGRGAELRRLIRTLCRKTKSNVILIGEPGVGKSALSEALAQRIVDRDVPQSLQGSLWALDMGLLIAGASHKGEFEERVKAVIDEAEKSEEPCLLFVDEIHLLLIGKDAGGIDAGNLLKPALARGKLRVIGATTMKEYQNIEKDAALERRFGVVLVEEPTESEAISILRGVRQRYELHHAVTILDEALVAAVKLGKRYLSSKRLPDSALDCLDEACAGVKLERDSVPEHVDALERKRLQLEVEIAALDRETQSEKRLKSSANASATKERLEAARKEMTALDDELGPLKAAHEASNRRGDEIQGIKQRIDELVKKQERAERERDLSTASDLRFYAIPSMQSKLAELEQQKNAEDEARTDLVTAEHIAEVVARLSGVPVAKLRATETERLLRLESILSRSIRGQDEAVKAVAEAIRLSRSGLVGSSRPIASFMFCGPSGTGKTELSKTLSRFLFDSEDAMIRIDGSEYRESHAISRLIGAPPGYVGHSDGGFLTEAVKRRPFSVILVDELEKAHKDFATLWLQVLDAGRLTDGQSRLVDFRNTVIIFTSNIGSHLIQASPDGPLNSETKSHVMDAVRSTFLPEFLGRLDAVVIFNRLELAQITSIVDLRLAEIQHRLNASGKSLKLCVSDEAKSWVAAHGTSAAYGARPLARVLQQNILVPLSRLLLDGSIADNADEVAHVELDRARNTIYIKPNHAPKVTMDDSMDLDELDIEEMD